MKIIPSVLEPDREKFSATLARLVNLADDLQVDFNDGSFQGFKTVMPDEVVDILSGYPDKRFEAHMMVQDPIKYRTAVSDAGFSRVIFQAEIAANLRDVLFAWSGEETEIGLSLAPATELSAIEPFLEEIRLVNILSVEPGVQGGRFIPGVLKKISDLRDEGYAGEIELDGGIDDQNLVEIKSAGPDSIVVGSFLVQAANPLENFQLLSDII